GTGQQALSRQEPGTSGDSLKHSGPCSLPPRCTWAPAELQQGPAARPGRSESRVVRTPALMAGLAFIAPRAVALVAGRTFVALLPGGRRGNPLLQLLDLETLLSLFFAGLHDPPRGN